MENFDWTSFNRRIAVKVPMHVIYEAWTKSSELEKWFLNTAHYTNKRGMNISPMESVQEDSTYTWTWYLFDDVGQGDVLKANGKDHFQFTFAGQCIVDIVLTEKDGFTVVDLRQSNIPTDDASKRGIRLGCHTGWSFFMLNLKSFYEFGNDLRNKNPTFKGMVNN